MECLLISRRIHIHSSWAGRKSTEKNFWLLCLYFLIKLQNGLVNRAYLQKCSIFNIIMLKRKREIGD